MFAAAHVLGCTKQSDNPNPAGPLPPEPPRIVSLSPAISRTLVDFDLATHVVGRTAFCRALTPDIPVVGDLREIDLERLIRLEPTHILVQPSSAGLPAGLADLAAERGWTIGSWTLDTRDDVERMIRELPGVLYGGTQGEAAASRRAAQLVNDMAAAISAGGEPVFAGRTLLVADPDDLLVYGRGTFLDDILGALGGVNASEARGWPVLSLEDLIRMDPDAVVIVCDRGPPGVDPIEAAGPIAAVDIAAARDGRIAVLWHPDANLPSSALIGVARELRAVMRRFAAAGDAP